MKEDATEDLTCTADDRGHPNGLDTLRIIQSTGSGVLAADTDPANNVVKRRYDPNDVGKSRQAVFSCIATASNSSGTFTESLTVIVRDAQKPAWDPAAPVLPARGADGNPPGKVGITFFVDVDVKDDALAPGARGVESGIYTIGVSGVNIASSPAIYTTRGVPPGPPSPGSQAGPLQDSQSFTVTRTRMGGQRIGIFVEDTAGNELAITLGIECAP